MSKRFAILIIPEEANETFDFSSIFSTLPSDSKITDYEDARNHGFFGYAFRIENPKFKEHILGKALNYIHPTKDINGLYFVEKDNCPMDKYYQKNYITTSTSMEDALSYLKNSLEEIDKDIAIKKECKHVWKQYNGIIEHYEYCIHCDIKRHEL